MKYTILLLLVLNISINGCFSQNHKEFVTELDKFIGKEKDKKKVTGVSVSLAIDGQVLLSKGYGFANKKDNITVDQHTQFAVGSISKLITSTAVLKLYSNNLIDIDKPYTYYVPEFSIKQHFKQKTPFTIRHLLTHFAGLPRVHAKGYSLIEERPLSRILDISRDSYLIAPPALVSQYSDWGTDLLALLVEKVSGLKFEEFVAKEVFEPLQMNESWYGSLQETKSYHKGVVSPTYEYSYVGSDGLNSTSLNLMNLGQMYLDDGKFDGKAYIMESISRDAKSAQFINAPLRFSKRQGFMWDINQFSQYKRLSKGGIHEPFYSMLYVVPEYKMVLAICSNSNSSSSIHRSIYSEVIDHLSTIKKGIPSNISEPPLRRVSLSNEQISKVEGTYSTDQGIVDIQQNRNKFKVTFDIMDKAIIGYPYSNNTIRIKAKILGLVPVKVMDVFWAEVDNEVVVGEQYSSGHRSLGGVKVQKKPIPENWENAVGIYKVSNLLEDEYSHLERLELKVNQYGILELSGTTIYPTKFDIQLAISPISDSLAIIPGYSFEFFAGETIELSENNGKTTLLISGYELSKIN